MTVTTAGVVPSAGAGLGAASIVDAAALGMVVKVTCARATTRPSTTASTLSTPGDWRPTLPVTWPPASVLEASCCTSAPPTARSETAAPGMGFPNASRTVATNVTRVPSAGAVGWAKVRVDAPGLASAAEL